MRDTVDRRDFLKRTAGMSLVAFASKPRLSAAQPVPERDRYLLIDSRTIEYTDNARLTPGTVHKHAGNPLFGEDKPWEKRFDNVYAWVGIDASRSEHFPFNQVVKLRSLWLGRKHPARSRQRKTSTPTPNG